MDNVSRVHGGAGQHASISALSETLARVLADFVEQRAGKLSVLSASLNLLGVQSDDLKQSECSDLKRFCQVVASSSSLTELDLSYNR